MACNTMHAALSALSLMLLASNPTQVDANAFLRARPEQVPSEQMSLDVQHALLDQLEVLLGSGHKGFTERRIGKIEEALRPIVTALPKNSNGKLDRAAASYALHRAFVQRHGWSVKGLQSETKAHAAWTGASPVGVFQTGAVSEHVAGAFEQRISDQGFGLHELALVAATLEHSAHLEAIERLRLAYASQNMTAEDVVGTDEADDIIDSYMTLFVLGDVLPNPTTASPAQVHSLRMQADDFYPGWNDTQVFMREIKGHVAPKRDYLYFSDVAAVIEEAAEQYGTFQDKECRTLKNDLVAIEDTDAGGAGRVRLADFYKLAVHDGKSQFAESIDFLRRQGALDETIPSLPRVIIANYISSPSNCIASSKFFSVCCIDECEGLFQQIERRIAGPTATPELILSTVSSITSRIEPQNRTLSSGLQGRLQEIAAHHGGSVPLHGRLFTQWMHFAFPRECSYPHDSDAIQEQQLPKETALSGYDGDVCTEQQMRAHIDTLSNQTADKIEPSAMDEFPMWSMKEELVVRKPQREHSNTGISSLVRGLAFVCTAASAIVALKSTFTSAMQSEGNKGMHGQYV